jgi:hypothetical protein
LCKLAAKHKLPKNNDLYFIESLIRLTNNKKYLCELNKLKSDILNNQRVESKKSKIIRDNNTNAKKEIKDGIDEYYNND